MIYVNSSSGVIVGIYKPHQWLAEFWNQESKFSIYNPNHMTSKPYLVNKNHWNQIRISQNSDMILNHANENQ